MQFKRFYQFTSSSVTKWLTVRRTSSLKIIAESYGIVIHDNRVVDISFDNLHCPGLSTLLDNDLWTLATNDYCASECYANETGPDPSTRMLTKIAFQVIH